MTGLLGGVKVVETGVLMTVDYLGRLLGDEGAEVQKVETPQLGDYLRNIMTRFAPDWSSFHLTLNRNKRSVTVDARTEAGREIMARMLADADVFITGNVGDTNVKLGLDYESVRRIKPDIVYCQATGYGASGPYAALPTHGQMMEALGASAPMGRDESGFVEPTGEPVNRGSGGVVIGPLYAAFAVASALARAARTGEGCYIDVSCADAVIASSWIVSMPELNPERIDPASRVAGSAGSAKYQHYETRDGGFILFCCIEAKFWRNWCRAVGREDLVGSHADDLVVDFGRGEDDLRRTIQEIFLTRTQDEWMEIALEHDIAMGPAIRFDEIGDNVHLSAREVVVTEHHPVFGDIRTLGNPIRVPGQTFSIRSAPTLGEHTDEILEALGYDAADRGRLRDAGVIR